MFRFGGSNFRCVLDGSGQTDDGGDNSGPSGVECGHVSCFSGGHFRGVLNLDGGYQVGDGSDGQVVGEDAESAGVGGVRDTDLLSFWVEISVAADLVAESIAVVGGGLSGVSVAETSLTQLILCVVLTGRYPKRKRSRKESTDSVAVIVDKLRLCGHSQNQQAKCDLAKRNKKQ